MRPTIAFIILVETLPNAAHSKTYLSLLCRLQIQEVHANLVSRGSSRAPSSVVAGTGADADATTTSHSSFQETQGDKNLLPKRSKEIKNSQQSSKKKKRKRKRKSVTGGTFGTANEPEGVIKRLLTSSIPTNKERNEELRIREKEADNKRLELQNQQLMMQQQQEMQHQQQQLISVIVDMLKGGGGGSQSRLHE